MDVHLIAMKILVVSTWWPFPLDNGSRVRAYHLLSGLSKRHRITLLSFGAPRAPEDVEPLRAFCERIEIVAPTRPPGARLGLRGLLSAVPRHYVQTDSPQMRSLVRQFVPAHDVALGLQVDAARYLAGVPGIARVFEEVETTVPREQYSLAHGRSRVRHGLTWWKFRRFIQPMVDEFERSTVVSAREREQLERIGCDSARISVVPNGVEIPGREPPAVRAARLIYPGSVLYSANLDAVRYFASEIFPLIRRVRPDVSFCVTGAVDGVDLSELTAAGVTFTGRLAEVDSLIAESAVCVVPLRTGGGTRLKVLQAMGIGTPVVSTAKGIEGLAVEPGRHVLVGESPSAFADHVLRVMDDEAMGARLTRDARQLARERYDWSAVTDLLEETIDGAVLEHARRGATGSVRLSGPRPVRR